MSRRISNTTGPPNLIKETAGLSEKNIFNLNSSNLGKIQNIVNEVRVRSNFKRRSNLHEKNRCPLCINKAEIFYCAECIQHGNFCYSSSIKIPNRFAEVKFSVEAKHLEFEALEKRLLSGGNLGVKVNKLKESIESTKGRISLLKNVISNEKSKLRSAKEKEAIMQNHIQKMNKSLPNFRDRLKLIEESIGTHNDRIVQKKKTCGELDAELKMLRSEITKDLFRYVCPISKVNDDLQQKALKAQLADALETHYVDGVWITSPDFQQVQNYRVLSSILPESGNYTDSILNCNLSCSELTSKKEAQNICAGLGHICQVTNVLANLYDIQLPKKIVFSDFNEFSRNELKTKDFQRMVSKLNANVLYLCVSQGIAASNLHPHRAVSNIVNLIDGEQVIRGGDRSFEFTSPSIDLAIENYEDFSDHDSDSDWETVSAAQVNDIVAAHQMTPVSSRRQDDIPSSLVSSTAAYVMAGLKELTISPFK